MKLKDKFREKKLIVKCGTDIFLPFAIIFGLYVILFGTVSPGGGFQGGVIVASAVLMIYLGYGYRTLVGTVDPEFMRIGEALSAIVYVALGLAGIAVGANFCRNFIFNNGEVGDMISAGNISFMSYTVGFKVLSGVGFLLILMLGIIKPEGTAGVKAEISEASVTETASEEVKAEISGASATETASEEGKEESGL